MPMVQFVALLMTGLFLATGIIALFLEENNRFGVQTPYAHISRAVWKRVHLYLALAMIFFVGAGVALIFVKFCCTARFLIALFALYLAVIFALANYMSELVAKKLAPEKYAELKAKDNALRKAKKQKDNKS